MELGVATTQQGLQRLVRHGVKCDRRRVDQHLVAAIRPLALKAQHRVHIIRRWDILGRHRACNLGECRRAAKMVLTKPPESRGADEVS